MFVLESVQTLRNAITGAKRLHPKVRLICFGEYEVTGSNGEIYIVRCFRQNSQKVVDCNCKAGEHGKPCKHAAAALAVHLYWASQRLAA